MSPGSREPNVIFLKQCEDSGRGEGRTTAKPGLNILLVEDNPDDVFLAEQAIRLAGAEHSCFHVSNGEEAIAYLGRKGRFADGSADPFPDLILLDLGLPKVDGLGVLEWMRTCPACEKVTIVVWSGWEYPLLIRVAQKAGVTAVVSKEVGADQLSKLVRLIAQKGRTWSKAKIGC